jgi:hypothetical protein
MLEIWVPMGFLAKTVLEFVFPVVFGIYVALLLIG